MRQAESESERLNRPRPTFLRYHSGRGASILPLANPSVVRELAERYEALTWQDPLSSTIGDRKSLSNGLPIIRAGRFGMCWHPSHGQTPGTLGHRLILEPRFTAHSLQASGSAAKFSTEARFSERIALEGKENYFRDPTTFTSERYFTHGSQIGSTGPSFVRIQGSRTSYCWSRPLASASVPGRPVSCSRWRIPILRIDQPGLPQDFTKTGLGINLVAII